MNHTNVHGVGMMRNLCGNTSFLHCRMTPGVENKRNLTLVYHAWQSLSMFAFPTFLMHTISKPITFLLDYEGGNLTNVC